MRVREFRTFEAVAGPRIRRSFGETGALVALAVVIAAVALASAWPWLPATGGDELDRYAPRRDGDSALIQTYDPQGRLISWESQNTAVVPTVDALSNLRQAQQDGIKAFYADPGETGPPPEEIPVRLDGVRVLELRSRTLRPDGSFEDTTSYIIREPDGGYRKAGGEYFAGVYTDSQDVLYAPPALVLPHDLGADREEWSQEGKVGGEFDYELTGRVLGSGPHDGPLGEFDDCLEVETRVSVSQEGAAPDVTTSREWYCAHVGLVEARVSDGDGDLTERRVVVATDRYPGRADLAPPPGLAGEAPLEDPAGWSLRRLTRTRPAGSPGESTIPPLYLPTDPPSLLTASRGGGLVAFDPADPVGKVRWRFDPAGTVYGAPAFDPETGRIYFGATDKKLYALDARGLFLWAFETGDNVAARPLVTDGAVVFGSEDGQVYALDARTGVELWEEPFETGGPVVSSPALLGDDSAVIGSDDGAVYGLDAKTGERRWIFPTGGPVEAPIVADAEAAYVASNDGNLYALDAKGRELWRAQVGTTLRAAPALGGDVVFVVDETGDLTAIDRRSGRELWEARDGRYAGAQLVVGETLVVAGDDGRVYRFGLDGEEGESWTAPDAPTVAAGDETAEPGFELGPTTGGGAIWLADDNATVSRLGPAVGQRTEMNRAAERTGP